MGAEMIKTILKRVALTLSCQSGGKLAGLAGALAIAAAPAVLAGPTGWAHQATGFQSNGAVTVKSLAGGSYSGTRNPTGSTARMNQSAATQPPTVLVNGRAKAYRPNGASCVYPSLSPSDTEVDVYFEVDKTQKMDCWTDYPWAGTWRVSGSVIPCFVGMSKATRPLHCVVGGAVQASANDTTIVGRYGGVIAIPTQNPTGTYNHDVIVDLADLPSPAAWGCYGDGIAFNSGYIFGWAPASPAWVHLSYAGQHGTARIKDMMNKSPCTTNYYKESAAILCLAKGPTWYLPASQELRMMADNRSALGGFSNAQYWASDENGPNNSNGAMTYNFATSTVVAAAKYVQHRVRCARSFD